MVLLVFKLLCFSSLDNLFNIILDMGVVNYNLMIYEYFFLNFSVRKIC